MHGAEQNDQWFINIIVVNTVTGEKMYVANIIVTNLVAFAVRSVTEDLRTRQKKEKDFFFSIQDKCESIENHQNRV